MSISLFVLPVFPSQACRLPWPSLRFDCKALWESVCVFMLDNVLDSDQSALRVALIGHRVRLKDLGSHDKLSLSARRNSGGRRPLHRGSIFLSCGAGSIFCNVIGCLSRMSSKVVFSLPHTLFAVNQHIVASQLLKFLIQVVNTDKLQLRQIFPG